MIDLTTLDKFRLSNRAVMDFYGWAGDGTFGVFSVPSIGQGRELYVIASRCGDTTASEDDGWVG